MKHSPILLALAVLLTACSTTASSDEQSAYKPLPRELNGLSNADWAWHGSMDFAAFISSFS